VNQPYPAVVAELLIEQVRQKKLRIQSVPAEHQTGWLDLD
jgi:hypothetical protein